MISPNSIVETQDIGDDVTIGHFAVVQKGVKLGHRVVLHSHVVIESGATIGDDVEIFPFAYIGKPRNTSKLLHRPVTEALPSLTIGSKCSIGVGAVIYTNVEIGSDCLIGDGASIREWTTIGSSSIIGRSVNIDANVSIGSRTRILDFSFIAGNSQIGDDVFISVGIMSANDNSFATRGFDIATIKGQIIQSHAKIGLGAIFLPGVVVGESAVVAAGSIVTANVPDRALVKGVAARVVGNVD